MVGASARMVRSGAALLAFAPIVVLPGALDRFTLPKAAVGAIGATLVLTVPGRPLQRRLRWALAAAAVVMVVAASLGANPMAQLLGRAPRYEGILIGAAYLLAFLSGTRLFSPGMAALQRWFAQWSSAGVIATAAVALAEVSGIRLITSEGWRSGSMIGNATELGAYGVLALGFLGFRALRSREGWSIAGALAALVCIVLCGSRAALIGALVTLVVLALVALKRERRAVLVGGIVLAAGVLAAPLTRQRVLGDSPLSASTVTGRVDTWEATWTLVRSRPLGVGPSGFMDAVPGVLDARWYREQPADLVLDSPHSLVLQLWAAGGPAFLAVGCVGLGLLVMAAWPRLRMLRSTAVSAKAARPAAVDWSGAALLGLPGYLVVLLTHFTGPTTTVAAAAFAGAAVPLAARGVGSKRAGTGANRRGPARQVEQEHLRRGDRRWIRCGAVVSVILVLAAIAEVPLRSAITALEQGDVASAEASFGTALALRPWTRPDTALTALHAYAARARNGDGGQSPPPARWVEVAGPVLEHSPVGLGDAGSVAEAAGNLAAADRYFTAARRLAPYDPLLMLRHGVVAAELGDSRRAEDLFRRAAATVPQSPDPWRNLAVLYGQLGRTAQQQEAAAHAERLQAAQ